MDTLIPGDQIPTTVQGFFDNAWRWANREDFEFCKIAGEDLAVECQYRSDDGKNCCLIGASIPDNLYSAVIEDVSVEGVPGIVEQFREADLNILSEMQQAHDLSISQKGVITKLKAIAEEHNLTIPTDMTEDLVPVEYPTESQRTHLSAMIRPEAMDYLESQCYDHSRSLGEVIDELVNKAKGAT